MRIIPISSLNTSSFNKTKRLSFKGVGLYEPNNENHTPTKEDLVEIEKINGSRGTLLHIEPNRLFKTFEQYASIFKTNKNANWYLNFYHQNKGKYGEICILRKKDLESISDNSPLYRFQYVKDLKNSKDDKEFYVSLKYKIYSKKIKNIDDPKILKHLFNDDTDFYEGEHILDAINSCKGRYIPFIKIKDDTYKTFWGDFDIFLQKNSSSAKKVMEGELPKKIQRYATFQCVPEEYIKKDIELGIQYNSINSYMENINYSKEMQDYLYYNYYLKNIKNDIYITDEQIRRCKKINNVYGTKIILSSDTRTLDKSLDYIEKEFGAWMRASNWKAKMPKIIDFSYAYEGWYKDSAAYTNRKNKLGFPGSRYGSVVYGLRHELMHVNEMSDYDNTLFENVKEGRYENEFWKAGIRNPKHITYAHTNSSEYIAVASEGNMKKYSPEFKEILVKLGMPKWAFNLDEKD